MNINPNTDDAKQQAQAVMHKFTSNLLEENMEQWISLFDDNAVFEFPYAPKHLVQVLQGKAAIYEYIKEFPSTSDSAFLFTNYPYDNGPEFIRGRIRL
ncbi:nuclear transport factor 2 family protein [Paenibacillus sp. Mc5Re-14]|uniref:nuclear transport factor 2 family protein n=1 Tax=Paenibacillus sp. Mc5Re-14 TaxID=1030529 RepID=UPI000A7B1AA8|nr:nuclear transport factor 2 family protein [Paenibacillus sp. Mc5Re-14]